MRHVALIAASSLTMLGACLTPEDSLQAVPGREDMVVAIHHARIINGLSGELEFEAPEGIQSVLVEVRGDKGLYHLDEFKTPAGDLIEAGTYTTRGAREVPGLVDWLYPNTPRLSLDAGTYKILLRAETPSGARPDEEVEIRFYAKKQTEFETCGIHMDFLVDENAIDAADIEVAIDRATKWVNELYAPLGVQVADYQIVPITLPNPNFNPEDGESVKGQISDVLSQARAQGKARAGSVHIVVVHQIGGADPSGYAMGLPGPFDADRPNSAVLVSTSAYTDSQGFLDVDGMASTIAHETGHFLGLYHTSEKSGEIHDPINDTPECSGSVCPATFHENIMTPGGGSDRITVTEGQAFVLKQHPLCQPMELEGITPKTCDLACEAPQTCSVLDGNAACRRACDGETDMTTCAIGETCVHDELGTFVCK
jgi:hypothetical protein